jgi:hypothetical protein
MKTQSEGDSRMQRAQSEEHFNSQLINSYLTVGLGILVNNKIHDKSELTTEQYPGKEVFWTVGTTETREL